MQTPTFPDTLAPPLGHYVPAIVHAGLVYVSGTLPNTVNPDALTADAPFSEQMQQLLLNLEAILQASASAAQQVLTITLYLTDLDHWPVADRMLAAFFGAHRPARTMLYTPHIRKGYAVQATLIATTQGHAP